MECDIIIPVWNQLAFTRDCVDSILKNTAADYRVIIIDNASDDETKRYLETLAAAQGAKVALVRNEKNLGFVKAVNQGFGMSKASYVCVLNNDTLVTRGWLETMLRVAKSSKDIGVVNPSSNNLGQRPAEGEPIDRYAEGLRKLGDTSIELGAAIGFCMLIKKEVMDKIGLFDEMYGMGNFEDTDFCRRAIKEGYRCVRACGAYVYHRENTSFNKIKTFNEDFERNKEIYEFRWGKPKRVAYVLDHYDANILKRLESEALALARGGNWVWYFSNDDVATPSHSNILRVALPHKRFYLAAAFRILKKKKKFSEIFVGEERFGKVLEALSFIHKAKVMTY